MARSITDKHLTAIDEMRRLLTRIEFELVEPEPDRDAVQVYGLMISSKIDAFKHFEG